MQPVEYRCRGLAAVNCFAAGILCALSPGTRVGWGGTVLGFLVFIFVAALLITQPWAKGGD